MYSANAIKNSPSRLRLDVSFSKRSIIMISVQRTMLVSIRPCLLVRNVRQCSDLGRQEGNSCSIFRHAQITRVTYNYDTLWFVFDISSLFELEGQSLPLFHFFYVVLKIKYSDGLSFMDLPYLCRSGARLILSLFINISHTFVVIYLCRERTSMTIVATLVGHEKICFRTSEASIVTIVFSLILSPRSPHRIFYGPLSRRRITKNLADFILRSFLPLPSVIRCDVNHNGGGCASMNRLTHGGCRLRFPK